MRPSVKLVLPAVDLILEGCSNTLPSDKAGVESAETPNLFLDELLLSIKIILAKLEKFRATSKRVFDGKNLFTVWNIATQ